MPKPSEQAAFGIYPQAGKRGQRKPTAKEQLAQIFSDDRAVPLPQFGDNDLSVPSAANRAMGQRMVERDVDLKRQSDQDMSPLEKIAGGIQTGRLIGSGMYQAAKSLPTAITKGSKAAEDYIAENIYKPNQPKAYEYAEDIGNFLQSLESDYKIPPIIPEAMALQNVIGPAARQGARNLSAPRTLNSQAGVFVGPKAKTWNKAKADMAVAMEEARRTPEEIWQATGTFRGADGILRQEIDDRAAKLVLPDEQQDRVAALKGRVGEMKESIKPTPQKDLFPKALTEAKKGVRSDIDVLKEEISGRSKNARTQGIDAQYAFDHPELYEAYPELRNLNITMGGNEGASQGAMGSLSVLPKSGGYPGHMEMDMYNRGLMSKNPTSTALHEMQHAVQTLEGMGPGGSPTFAFQNPEAFEILKQIRKEAYKPASLQEFQKANKYPDAEAHYRYIEYLTQLRDGANANPVIERALQERAAMEYYKRLAGEAEARAVQDRQMMTPQQRLQYPPPTSYDVPQEDLIVKPPREYADGGPVHFSDNPDVMQLELAGGGLVKKLASTVGKAAESAGMKAPVTAGKDLTTLQDVHTNLGDRVRAGAMEAQKMMGGFDYQYDKGQRVFTKDSAGKNKPPYTILNRTRVGNQVMREDHPEFGPGMGRPIIDPETGKAMRSPYEPGYRVRMERGPDDWSEFEIPQKAIVGDVEMAAGGAVQMAGGGALSKLAKLARAPAKTKAEISAIAERLAPQVTGEYVRKDAKSAKTVAGKTQKQFQREKTLPVDVRTTGEERVPELVDIEKLKGDVMIGVPGDPTLTGKTLYSVGDFTLGSPSPQHGGPLYGLYSDDAFWASGIGPARGVQNLAKRASKQYDAPVKANYIMMGPDSINYAQHFADANLQAIDLSRMSKAQVDQFNELIRNGSKKSGPRESFPGIEDKDSAYLQMAMDPELRKHFNALMQMPTITEALNLPSGTDIRFAITEPSLRDLETGVTGYSMGKMRPDIASKDLPRSTHPTYDYDIPGEFMGQSRYPMPYELSFPDTLQSIRANPKQARQEFGSLKMVGPRQTIDQQMIDEIKMYEERMKALTGKKKGGAVRKAEGGEITADDLILEERKL